MENKYWEELANKYSEVRVFIEFADAHEKQFDTWLKKEIAKTLKSVKKKRKKVRT